MWAEQDIARCPGVILTAPSICIRSYGSDDKPRALGEEIVK